MAALNKEALKPCWKRCFCCNRHYRIWPVGHLHEMLIASGVAAELEFFAVPFYPGTRELAAQGLIPGGAYRNLDYLKGDINCSDREALLLLADPQTSGGLLLAVSPERQQILLDALQDRAVMGCRIEIVEKSAI